MQRAETAADSHRYPKRGAFALTFALRYAALDIGNITGAFCGEEATGTWFGNFLPSTHDGQGADEKRIRDVISFCRGWHRRHDEGETPGDSEFDDFKDIVDSDQWSIETPDRTTKRIGCPVFYGDEITWNTPDHA